MHHQCITRQKWEILSSFFLVTLFFWVPSFCFFPLWFLSPFPRPIICGFPVTSLLLRNSVLFCYTLPNSVTSVICGFWETTMVSHPFWEIPGGLVDDLQLQWGEAGAAVLCLVPSRVSRAGERCLSRLQLSALKIHFSIALSHVLCFAVLQNEWGFCPNEGSGNVIEPKKYMYSCGMPRSPVVCQVGNPSGLS